MLLVCTGEELQACQHWIWVEIGSVGAAKIKSLDPTRVLTSDEVEWVIHMGDDLFLETALDVMVGLVSLRAAAIDT